MNAIQPRIMNSNNSGWGFTSKSIPQRLPVDNQDGTNSFVNREARNMFETHQDRMIGMKWDELRQFCIQELPNLNATQVIFSLRVTGNLFRVITTDRQHDKTLIWRKDLIQHKYPMNSINTGMGNLHDLPPPPPPPVSPLTASCECGGWEDCNRCDGVGIYNHYNSGIPLPNETGEAYIKMRESMKVQLDNGCAAYEADTKPPMTIEELADDDIDNSDGVSYTVRKVQLDNSCAADNKLPMTLEELAVCDNDEKPYQSQGVLSDGLIANFVQVQLENAAAAASEAVREMQMLRE